MLLRRNVTEKRACQAVFGNCDPWVCLTPRPKTLQFSRQDLFPITTPQISTTPPGAPRGPLRRHGADGSSSSLFPPSIPLDHRADACPRTPSRRRPAVDKCDARPKGHLEDPPSPLKRRSRTPCARTLGHRPRQELGSGRRGREEGPSFKFHRSGPGQLRASRPRRVHSSSVVGCTQPS